MGNGRDGGKDKLGGWEWQFHTEVYETMSQEGADVQHRELYPVFSDNLCGKRI